MILLQTILSFAVVLAVLIVVHELGHYWVARLCNVKVLRFSVGMGKVVFSRRFGPDQTEWAISVLPLGGYVKMLDARETDVSQLPPADLKREFTRQSVWKRSAIVAAGPLANFILAILIFFGMYSYGMPEPVARLGPVPEQTAAHAAGLRGGDLVTSVNGGPVKVWSELRWKVLESVVAGKPVQIEIQRPEADGSGSTLQDKVTLPAGLLSADELEGDFLGKLGFALGRSRPVLGRILPDGAGAQAGLQSGDLILEVDGKPVADIQQFIQKVEAAPGQPLQLRGIHANGRPFDTTVVPHSYTKDGRTIGRIQVELAPEMAVTKAAPLQAVSGAVEKTWDTSVLILRMLGKMLIGEASLKNISGPITLADYAGQTARIGLISFLSFIAFISISLGVMNLLPIPVLDGGHLLYYALEIVTGRPLPERIGEMAQRAGIGILMALMAVAVFNDFVRLLS